ncbi:nuclease harbi1-like, partial [Moniliophthora roreri MCA 2997]
ANETISKYFNEVLNGFSSACFYGCYIQQPKENDPVYPFILNNPKLYSFFKDALGAMDGTYINSWATKEMCQLAWNRKGNVTQNTLVCCDFRIWFQYAVGGYNGSAADATMYAQSQLEGLQIPNGKYYLADVEFGICNALLVLYCGVQYHLNEWGRSQLL